jgi:hypothetical protein
MRHVFVSLPPMMIYAALGLKKLTDTIQASFSSWKKPLALTGCLIAFSGYYARQIRQIHPFEGEYFNEVFRYFWPQDISNSFEFPTWLNVLKQGADWLNENAKLNAVVYVPRGLNLLRLYSLRRDLIFMTDLTKGTPDYGLYLPDNSELGDLQQFEKPPLYEIKRYNSLLLSVYPMNG